MTIMQVENLTAERAVFLRHESLIFGRLFLSIHWIVNPEFLKFSKMSLLGLDKVWKFFRIIAANGGIRKSYRLGYVQDDLKIGKLVGEDKYGNQYYENNEYFYGRNRWVSYNLKHNLEYDASMVPAEWYGWLHYKTDIPPTVQPPPQYKWLKDHTPNYSGTPYQYVPYTTTTPKIEAWVPPKPKKST